MSTRERSAGGSGRECETFWGHAGPACCVDCKASVLPNIVHALAVQCTVAGARHPCCLDCHTSGAGSAVHSSRQCSAQSSAVRCTAAGPDIMCTAQLLAVRRTAAGAGHPGIPAHAWALSSPFPSY